MPKWSIKFVTDKRDDNFTCSGTVSDCDKPGEAPYGLAADIQNMFYYHGQRNYVSLAFTCICMSVEFSEKTASLFFFKKTTLVLYAHKTVSTYSRSLSLSLTGNNLPFFLRSNQWLYVFMHFSWDCLSLYTHTLLDGQMLLHGRQNLGVNPLFVVD